MVKFGLSEYYVLNADDLTLREAQKRKGQKTVFSVLFDSYHIVGNLLIPLNLKIKLPAVNTEVNMLLSSVSLNKNFPSRLYWVEIPKGYSVKHR